MYSLILLLGVISVKGVMSDILVYSLGSNMIEIELKDVPSTFGGSIPLDGLKGMIVYSNPANACSTIDPPPQHLTPIGGWIALIMRYGCNFDVKVRNAQIAGYDAAIVHNVNSSELEPMGSSHPAGIMIPSVFVSDESGGLLRDIYQYEDGYYVIINDDLPFNISTHLLLPFLIVVGFCLLVMVTVLIIRCIKERRRQRRYRLPNSALKKIPIHKFKKNDPYEVCAICLEDYVENEKLRVLPCSHAYHSKCIDPWLTKNRRVCPVCKRKIFAAGECVTEPDSSDNDDERSPLVWNSPTPVSGGTFETVTENPNRELSRNLWRTRQASTSYDTANDSSSDSSSTSGSCHTDTEDDRANLISNEHSINSEPPVVVITETSEQVEETNTTEPKNDSLVV